MTRPSGIAVPGVASGTTSPACMLNAPHHTWRSTPVAGVDVDTVDLRRVGVPFGAQDAGGDDTGDGGADVDRSPRPRGRDRSCVARWRRCRRRRRELVEPGVDDLHQNCSRKRRSLLYISRTSPMRVALLGHAVDAEAEREAAPLLGVEAAGAQHVGMHHAAAAELEPFARRRLDVELGRRFGEREVARPQPGSEVGAEERLGERVDRAGEIGQRDAPVDDQALESGGTRRGGWRRWSRCGTRGPGMIM